MRGGDRRSSVGSYERRHRLGEWRSRPVRAEDEPAVEAALEKAVNIPLHRSLLAQGKDAALQGDSRRAVMEFAIACEVAAKQAFFAPRSAAGEAFEYLEDKNKVRLSVMELLREPARRAFGEGFVDHDSAAHEQLDWLFRCRNKVVHRGELFFRDDAGTRRAVDQPQLKAWFFASECLLDWLEEKAGLAEAVSGRFGRPGASD